MVERLGAGGTPCGGVAPGGGLEVALPVTTTAVGTHRL